METEKGRKIRIGIAGFGYMGHERLKALKTLRETGTNIEFVGVFDPLYKGVKKDDIIEDLKFFESYTELLKNNIDWIIIATPHNVSVNLCEKALHNDIKVLLEKPMGTNYEEAVELANSQKFDNQLWIGLNYRFFKGVNQLIKDVRNNVFGPLVSINVLMGHGGEPGYESNWKVGSDESGGGVLINEGIHLLDLCILLAGNDIEIVNGLKYSGFWGKNYEEECHFLMRSGNVPMINYQISIVKWRSTFRIEVYGTSGYGIVEGRGRSYGEQIYKRGRRWGWSSGKPQRETEEVVCQDDGNDVFTLELKAIINQPNSDKIKPSNAESGLQSMKLLNMCRKTLEIHD